MLIKSITCPVIPVTNATLRFSPFAGTFTDSLVIDMSEAGSRSKCKKRKIYLNLYYWLST